METKLTNSLPHRKEFAMSLPVIRIVDVQHNNEPVKIADLSLTALSSLMRDCEQLLDELTDAEAKAEAEETAYLIERGLLWKHYAKS